MELIITQNGVAKMREPPKIASNKNDFSGEVVARPSISGA